MKYIDAIVHGDVHGIGFRANTKNNADMLKITGYVENVDDGTVHVVGCGGEGHLLALVDFLNVGPSNSDVGKVDVTWSDEGEEYTEFEIR